MAGVSMPQNQGGGALGQLGQIAQIAKTAYDFKKGMGSDDDETKKKNDAIDRRLAQGQPPPAGG